MKKRIIYTVAAICLTVTSFSAGWLLSRYKKLKEETPEQETGMDEDKAYEMTYPSYWVYGMHEEKDRQRAIIASRLYGFRFMVTGGCTVTTEQEYETLAHNKVTDSIMSKRIGKNWLQKFEKSADSLYSLDSTAIKIASDNRMVANFLEKQKNSSGHIAPNFTSMPTPDNTIKIVNFQKSGYINGHEEMLSLLRVVVNLKESKVISIDTMAYCTY